MQNVTRQMILDVWRVNGEQSLGDATANDLTVAINRENNSAEGHSKNSLFYNGLKEGIRGAETVRTKWSEKSVRAKIEEVYGEFRKTEAA
jgi:hypothetical protein